MSRTSQRLTRSAHRIATEEHQSYGTVHSDEEAVIVQQAMAIIERRLKVIPREAFQSPQDTQLYLRMRIGHLEYEVFGVMWLDVRHRLLAIEELFRGTIDGASVYPREVVKAALKHNAAAAIFYHNHPSADSRPSAADLQITQRLRQSLALVEIRVLDHIIVGETCTSLAERGEL